MEKRLGAVVVVLQPIVLVLSFSFGLGSAVTAIDPNLNLSTSYFPLAFVLANNGRNREMLPPFSVSFTLGIEKMIRRGHEAMESMFPFIASLQILWSDNRMYHICGGTIFETNKILTAAHCMIYWGHYEHFVALGVQYISRGGEALIRVENASIHHNFRADVSQFPWDVAVLSLETHAVISQKVQLAKLANGSNPRFEKYEDCEVIGWGSTMGGSLPDGLHFAILKGISNNDCRRFLRIFKFRGLQQNHKCAWNWPHAACQGDSGGPLICEGWVVGVSSWGVTGCNGCFPSVFSRVSYYHDWIVSQ